MKKINILFFSFLFLISPNIFGQTKGWTKSPSVGAKSLVPKLSSDESYSERYSFSANLDGGGHIGADFTISNLGWGDGHGAIELRVNLPNQKHYKFRKKKDEDDWSYSKKSLKINIASTSIRALGNSRYQLKHNGRVKVDVIFTNTIPKWRPGKGQLKVEDGYYQYSIIAPRADVEGTVKIGGTTHKVKSTGNGYADHIATNVAPYDLADRYIRFRDVENGVFVAWREIKLTKEQGGKTFVWLVVGFKNKIVFSDASAKLKEAKVRTDSKTGYRIPYVVQVDGKSGADKVRLILQAKKMKRRDILKNYGAAAKAVASMVSEPFSFNLDSQYTMQLSIGGTKATVKGSGNYTIDYMNK